MDVIKKTIKQAVTTGTTSGSTENEYVIIPDTGATYHMKILLQQEHNDMGFFDVYPDQEDATGTTTGIEFSHTPYIVTGLTSSKLSELKKYKKSNNFFENYFLSTSSTTNGLDNNLSITGVSAHTLIYYIDGITYTEYSGDTSLEVHFSFESDGLSSPNFINKPIYKDINKGTVLDKPKIDDDVFIIRQELSVFEKNYRLEDIKNLGELTSYASGNYFNIVKNT